MLIVLPPKIITLSLVVVTAMYIPPQADTTMVLKELHWTLSKLGTTYPEVAVIVAGDLNKVNMRKSYWSANNTFPTVHALQNLSTIVTLLHHLGCCYLPSPPGGGQSGSQVPSCTGQGRDPGSRAWWVWIIFKKHVKVVIKTVKFGLSNFGFIRPFLPLEAAKLYMHAMIFSHLRDCLTCW